jgi:hypothetical protein
MAAVNDWVSRVSIAIAKRVLHGGADRSDIFAIERLLEEHCPFKRGVLYQEASLQASDPVNVGSTRANEASGNGSLKDVDSHSIDPVNVERMNAFVTLDPGQGIGVLSGKSHITLLPAIPNHSHIIGQNGHPTCGCKFLKGTPADAKPSKFDAKGGE